jgi:nucleoside-diphosphate-sugar epimerase
MHSAAAGGTFLVSDGADLSTTELLQGMKRALGARGFLFPVPVSLLTTLASMIGQGAVAQRLFGSLQIDLEPTRRTLSWNPPYPVQAALSRVARQFLDAQKR